MAKSINICFNIWNFQGQAGYVFLSEKTVDGGWKDKSFKWPSQKEDIKAWFSERKELANSNLYWCPLIFSSNRRKEELALASKVLFADLDPINPETLSLRPSVAWASSKDRYQALWKLSEAMDPEELREYNRRLTYLIGADKGGWDLTQVLRVPDTPNFKYNPPIQGRTLWDDPEEFYDPELIKSSLPEVKEGTSQTFTIEHSLVQLLSKYRKRIPQKVSRLLQYPPSRVEQGHRSDILWYIESELIKARIPQEEIVEMIQQSSWNKYRGRHDELKRLTIEISKAFQKAQTEESPEAPEDEVEDKESGQLIQDLSWTSYSALMSGRRSSPGWLVKDVWLRKSHGIVAGEPKTFKSTIALDIAVSVASGEPLWGQFPVEETGPVMIIQNENAEWIIQDRIEKIINSKGLVGKVTNDGSDLKVKFPPELPLYFLNNAGYNFSDPLHREKLEEKVTEIKPALVIFDPLYLMFEGEINSAKDLQPILFWLMEIRNKYNTAVMVIHHWNKNGASSRGGQRMLGSTTLHGWTESALYIQSQQDEDSANTSSVTIEREFRAAGVLPKIDVSIKMGELGDPDYQVSFAESAGASNSSSLLDLLSMYPQGLSLSQISKELMVSRRRLTGLLGKVSDNIERIKGARGSEIIKLKGGD